MKVYSEKTNKLSWYKTKHNFSRIADITSRENYLEAITLSKEKNIPLYPLGNGSNTFFRRKNVESLILRNQLPQVIEEIGVGEFCASSSFKINKLLRLIYSKNLDGPYNLASVPATVGGAVAMNAGTGKDKGMYIEKFVTKVVFWKDDQRFEKPSDQLEFGFRRSIFSEGNDTFIESVYFKFPPKTFEKHPIVERLDWAREHQDLTKPNCGSVWRVYNGRLLRISARIFSRTPAYFSKKSLLWITNKSENPFYIKTILSFTRIIHRCFGEKCEEEIRIVD